MARRTALVLTLGLLLAALAAPAPAGAVAPDATTFDFYDVIESEAGDACPDFAVRGAFEGSITQRDFYDRSGNLVKTIMHGSDTVTVTNLSNGNSFAGHDAWTVILDWRAMTETVLGLYVHVNVPGAGVVLMDAGRLSFDYTTFELTVNGPHDLTAEGDFDALCAALA